MTSTLSPWRQFKATAIATIGVPVIEALGSTYNWRESGREHLAQCRSRGAEKPILALWHGRILAATLYFRDRNVVAMTSENFDGEWVAQLMQRFGYHAARGSTSRGGARALAQLRRDMADGHSARPSLSTARADPHAWLNRARPGWRAPPAIRSFRFTSRPNGSGP